MEPLGETLSLEEPVEDEPAEDLGQNAGVERGEGDEVPAFGQEAVGNKDMEMRMEVRGEGAEGLYGRHEAGERVPAAEDLLEAGLDRVVGRADEEAKEPQARTTRSREW